MRVAVLGNGSLSNAFKNYTKHDVSVFAKPNIDFLNPYSLDTVIDSIAEHDVVLNTIGLFNGSTSDVLNVNFVTPVLLIEKLIKLDYSGKIIMTGSHGSSWTSWPEINHERLMYNTSKLSLRNYVMALSQSRLTKAHLCIVDTTKFVSKMSNYTGDKIEDVAILFETIIETNSPKLLHVETY